MPAGSITYVGHATTVIEVDGTRLLTDPVLRSRIGHIRRIAPAPREHPRFDGILVSHAHHDHLDLRSLRMLPAGGPVLAPPGVARLIRRRTGHDARAVAPGDRARVGGVEVAVVEATHDERRTPLGRALGAVGYLVAGSARVYFAGDTDVFEAMRALSAGLDAALLPVWGWGPKVGPGHMDPERAAEAAALLAPRMAIPIHWGTLAGPRVWWRHDPWLPAREFERLAAVRAPGVAVRVLAPGATLTLPG